jgi:hypothetical protein
MKDEMSARQSVEKGASRFKKADLRKENVRWEIDGP